MQKTPRTVLLALSLLLLSVGGSSIRASPPTGSEELAELMELARAIAYRQNLSVDVSRADEGLMAIAFSTDGVVILHEPAIVAYRFFEKGNSIRYRGRLQLALDSPPLSQRAMQNHISTACSTFLNELESMAEQRRIRVRRAGSRLLGLLLAEDPVDLKPDPLLDEYRDEALSRFQFLPDAVAARATALEHRASGQYVQARGLLELALAGHLEMMGADHPQTVAIINELALVHQELGDHDHAWTLFVAAREQLERTARIHTAQGATVLFNVASFLREVGKLEEARKQMQRALEIHTAVARSDPVRAKIHNGLGLLLLDLGELDAAQEHFEQALKVFKVTPGDGLVGEKDPRESFPTLVNLGHVLLARGDLDTAFEWFDDLRQASERYFRDDHPQRMGLLFLVAWLHDLQGHVQQAVEARTAAVEANERFIASTLASGSARQRHLLMSQQAGYLNDTVTFHFRAAPESELATRLALEMILRRKARLADAEYRLRFFDRESDAEKVREVRLELRRLEAEKAKLYWSDHHSADSEVWESELSRLEGEIDRATTRLTSLAANLDHYPSYQDLDHRLAGKRQGEPTEPSAEEMLGARAIMGPEWGTPSLDVIQRAIPADAALVEFFVYLPMTPVLKRGEGVSVDTAPRRYAAYVLHRSGRPKGVDLGEAAIIDEAIAAFREAVAGRRSNARTMARRLDSLTMARIRPLLDDAERMLISPDGALNLVPFAALVDPAGRFLIESYEVSVVASGREVVGFSAPKVASTAALIVGDVDFGESDGTMTGARGAVGMESLALVPLPATAAEADAVGALVGAPPGRILRGNAATETAVKTAESPVILHLATHGLFLQRQDEPASHVSFEMNFDAAEPMPELSDPLLRSAVALAGFNHRASATELDDGVLTALELASMDLRGTEVAVLSACETGVGEVQNGEGVFGLRRALVLAGARTQVMSLWQVADEATKDLMISWYRQILDGVPRAEAMRRVQLAALRGEALPGTHRLLARGGRRIELAEGDSDPTLAGTRHPYYWAGFIVSGEPGPLPAVGERAP